MCDLLFRWEAPCFGVNFLPLELIPGPFSWEEKGERKIEF